MWDENPQEEVRMTFQIALLGKDGFVIADTEDAWSSSKGGWFSPSCQIAFIKKGNYKLLNGEGKQITIKIPYDGFMVYGEDDVEGFTPRPACGRGCKFGYSHGRCSDRTL